MITEKNSIFKSYILFWKNAFNFSSRTRRNDYWNVFIINLVLDVLLSFFNLADNDAVKMVTTVIMSVYHVLYFIPQLSITVRRLHDVGKSGFFVFVSFIPLAGQIILFVNLIKDSQREANAFGESPKYISDTIHESGKESLYCPICKSAVSVDENICPRCGSKINAEEIYGQL